MGGPSVDADSKPAVAAAETAAAYEPRELIECEVGEKVPVEILGGGVVATVGARATPAPRTVCTSSGGGDVVVVDECTPHAS